MIRLQQVAVLLLGLPVLLGQGQPSSSEGPDAKIWVGRNQEIEEYLRYLAAISGWLSDQGVAPEQAARYVRSIFANVGEDLADGRGDLDELASAHATPGGINERFSAMLDEAGVFATVSRSLQVIYDRLTGG